MYLILSEDQQNKEKLLNIIKRSTCHIFAKFCNECELETILNDTETPIYPNAVVIDAQSQNLEYALLLCDKIKIAYPSVKVGVILSSAVTEVSLFRYVPSADDELIFPFSNEGLIDFLSNLHSVNIPSVSLHFSSTAKSSYLLGYDMKLSPSENRILVFLSIFNNLKLSANTICEICLNTPPDKDRIATLRVLINRINKKAQNISSRPIILNSYENGYYINPEI